MLMTMSLFLFPHAYTEEREREFITGRRMKNERCQKKEEDRKTAASDISTVTA